MSDGHHLKPLILHPTDLSSEGKSAFAHALKIALMKKSGVYILHVSESGADEAQWEDFPAVRDMLVRWGLLEAGAPRNEVFEKLGLVIEKVMLRGKSVSEAIVNFRKQHRFGFEMMVVATAGREGLPRWLHPSVAEHIAREVKIPTLFVPREANTCVDLDDGAITLSRALVPVDHKPAPQVSIAAIADLARDMEIEGCDVTVIHAGSESEFPDVDLRSDEHCRFQRLAVEGDPVEAILQKADELQAELIVMTTQGHDGFLDVLRGSVSERVLHHSPCPVLAVPTDPRTGLAYTP